MAEKVWWAHVTFDNAKRANSLNTELMDEFARKVAALADEPELLAMVLTGAGERSFCAGANVHELVALTPSTGRAFILRVHAMSRVIRDLPVPVVARVNGVCLGAGLEIMIACDMRIASDHAVFGMPEVDIGLPSVVEAALLPQLIGWGRTKQLLYTATQVNAADAHQWGLVEEVTTPADLDAGVEKLVGAIVKADPRGVRMQKSLIRSWEAMSVSDAIQEGVRMFSHACDSDVPAKLVGDVIDGLKNRKS